MDSLRTEEVKRQKTAILKQFGLSEKTDPKSVTAKVKRKLQVCSAFITKTFIMETDHMTFFLTTYLPNIYLMKVEFLTQSYCWNGARNYFEIPKISSLGKT